MNIYKTVIFIFLLSNFLYGDSYKNFIGAQLQNYYQLDDANLSEQAIEEIVEKQFEGYDAILLDILSEQNSFLKTVQLYDKEIFALKKKIAINEKAGNSYAVMRDQVKLKSYTLLIYQREMLAELLRSLQNSTYSEYETLLNQYVAINQEKIATLNIKEYSQYILAEQQTSKVVENLQENIKELQTLIDINRDFIVYLYKFEPKMYRLNKYAKYHLIQPVIYIESFEFVQVIDNWLNGIGLSFVKILVIIFLSIVIYILRTVALNGLKLLMQKISYLESHTDKVIAKLLKPISSLLIVINVDMALYVYNDFHIYTNLSTVFAILYALYFTYLVYIGSNTVVALQLNKLRQRQTNIKKDVINVGVKIINFTILVIGLLIVLYIAGIDLTTVLSGLGIGGLAIAFAAKDTISNFFGTISILFSDVFSQGDWIVVDDKEGTVVEIGLRVTTIRTFDNALIAIPNGTFASKEVKNWNKRKVGRRIKMNIGVKYDSKAENIQNAVKEIKEMLLNHPDIATPDTKYEPSKAQLAKLISKDDLEGVRTTLLVYLDQFSSSSIDILIYCFSKTVNWEEWLQTKQDVMYKIMEILERNSLEFAFPSISVYQES